MPETNAGIIPLLEHYGEFAMLSLIILALVVLASVVLASVGLIVALRSQRHSLDRAQQRLEDLNSEVSSYGQSLISIRTMIGNMEARIGYFTERNLEVQSQLAFNRSFEEASRLIREGGTVESLVSDCGLSDAEASLMIRLHGKDEEKPRQQWKQWPVRESLALSEEEPDGESGGGIEKDVGDSEALVGEEIRLRETLRNAQAQS